MSDVTLRAIVTYPRDAIVETAHIAAALGVCAESVEKLDLPCFYVGRRARYVWGQVLDHLSERGKAAASPAALPFRDSRVRRSS